MTNILEQYYRQRSRPSEPQRKRLLVVTPPALEPLSLQQVKKHLEISSSDDAHDSHLFDLLRTAREQWEHDTDSAIATQQLRLNLCEFPECIELPTRPIQSLQSIKYYDSGNVQQTLSSTVYSLDSLSRRVRLRYLEIWPATVDRWDAIEVNFTAGYSAPFLVPMVAKQAMLLLIGYYFENRDMHANEVIYNRTAYESLVARFIRSTYP